MSQVELNVLPTSINPYLLLKFFDKYHNPTVNKKEVGQLQVATQIMVTDIDLYDSNDWITKLSDLCKTDKNKNEERWPYLPNGKDYKLIVIQTQTNERLLYPIELVGEYNDGDPDPIDVTKT